MATSHDQLIAPTPTLMGIPPECRARILEFVLVENPGIIQLKRLTEVVHDDSIDGIEGFKDKIYLRDVPHPLLLVSSKVHGEASQYYHVALSITSYEDARRLDEDDFRKNLSCFLRRAVSKVIVNSVRGYQGKHINQEQFPNLKSVNVVSLVGDSNGIAARPQDVYYMFKPTVHWTEVWDGSHDQELVAAARETADESVMHDVPAAENRAFSIFCKATVNFYETPVAMPQWLPSNMGYVPSRLFAEERGSMNITWDYDTGKLLKKYETN
ncbi:hypothetical protein LTR70_010352 [Exophiala xenobiotica]|uniref:Uncharacterized protein n=1 Tax=Lithohypha guttulata TaxID=1690604 RepID=A0ABR0JX75_9EURO|nr:hypothetical protein LTR24_009983 [Lithohypha guttulata]KAK5309374.1 hypothetical protein LTR70_010352 [Exophiala xenobiotica]